MAARNLFKSARRIFKKHVTPRNVYRAVSAGAAIYKKYKTSSKARIAQKKTHKGRMVKHTKSRNGSSNGNNNITFDHVPNSGSEEKGFCFIKSPLRRKTRGKFQSTWDYTNFNTQKLVSTVGNQNIVTLSNYPFLGDTLSAIYAKVIGNEPISIALPNISTAPGGNNFNELFIKSVLKTTEIVNVTPGAQTIWIYTVTPRTMWPKSAGTSNNPVSMAMQDYNTVTGSGSGTGLEFNDYNTAAGIFPVGWTPFKSPSLTKQWKIHKCEKYLIQPGHKVVYKTKIMVNRAIRADEIYQQSGTPVFQTMQWFRGTTAVTIIAQLGAVAHDSTLGTVQISYAATSSDVIEKCEYHGYWSAGTFKQSFNEENFPTSFTHGAQTQVEEQTGSTNLAAT
nr:MAG: capsid protein [Cressdnaviricota sp.]